jgi:hypothetical protein
MENQRKAVHKMLVKLTTGININVTNAPLMKQFFTFLADNYNISANISAYSATQLLNQAND